MTSKELSSSKRASVTSMNTLKGTVLGHALVQDLSTQPFPHQMFLHKSSNVGNSRRNSYKKARPSPGKVQSALQRHSVGQAKETFKCFNAQDSHGSSNGMVKARTWVINDSHNNLAMYRTWENASAEGRLPDPEWAPDDLGCPHPQKSQ